MKVVCFATPGVFPMLNGVGPYGGSELRAWRFACDLTARSLCEVRMLAYDYGQPEKLALEGVTFLRDSCNVYERGLLAKLRWRTHRLANRKVVPGIPLLNEHDYAAWEASEADVYIAFGTTDYSAKLARWCALRQRRFVLMHGSDMDLDPAEPNAASTYAFPGLSVAQTEFQSAELKTRYSRSSVVLPNPVAVPDALPFSGPREYALWVGKSDLIKCPDRMVELARRCPEIPVLMIMNRADSVIFEAVKRTAPGNVTFVDAVSPAAMQSYYRRAFVLVSTSRIEGFANSFLEAGACGTPILSMNVDTGRMLSEHKAGLLSDSLDAAAAALAEFHAARAWSSGALAPSLGENAYRYVAARHAQGLVFQQFAEIMRAELDRVS